MNNNKTEKATLAGGCFWCLEAIFKRLKGVTQVVSGYSGGWLDKPSSADAYSGKSGHAEAIQITFDAKIISYEKILEVFFKLHDPTTLNRQGADVGSQYRSAIFYHNPKQKKIAEDVKSKIEKLGIYRDKIVTEIVPFINFYLAENYHQNYYQKNSNNSYCRYIVDPKIQKLLQEFKEDSKNSN